MICPICKTEHDTTACPTNFGIALPADAVGVVLTPSPGWYWLRTDTEDAEWQARYFDGAYWYAVDTSRPLHHFAGTEYGPRIPAPDEEIGVPPGPL